MRVFKVFVDFDKEERWLNRMAAEGHLVVGASLWYTFAPVEPGRAVVRVDYRDAMKASDYADYLALFADAGWQHLAGSRHSGPQYSPGGFRGHRPPLRLRREASVPVRGFVRRARTIAREAESRCRP